MRTPNRQRGKDQSACAALVIPGRVRPVAPSSFRVVTRSPAKAKCADDAGMRVPSNVQTKATLSMPCQHWPAVVKHCLPAERRQQQQPAFPSRMRRKLKLISSVRSLSRRSSKRLRYARSEGGEGAAGGVGGVKLVYWCWDRPFE